MLSHNVPSSLEKPKKQSSISLEKELIWDMTLNKIRVESFNRSSESFKLNKLNFMKLHTTLKILSALGFILIAVTMLGLSSAKVRATLTDLSYNLQCSIFQGGYCSAQVKGRNYFGQEITLGVIGVNKDENSDESAQKLIDSYNNSLTKKDSACGNLYEINNKEMFFEKDNSKMYFIPQSNYFILKTSTGDEYNWSLSDTYKFDESDFYKVLERTLEKVEKGQYTETADIMCKAKPYNSNGDLKYEDDTGVTHYYIFDEKVGKDINGQSYRYKAVDKNGKELVESYEEK